MKDSIVLLLAVGVACALNLSAQNPGPPPPPNSGIVASGSVPPAGDPAVFVMFLNYQARVLQDLQNLQTASPSKAGELSGAIAASMHLSAADFAKINPVYQQLQTALAAIDRDANAYRDSIVAGNGRPDPAIIQQFSSRRDQAIAAGRAQLQKALSPDGWTSLNTYIDGAFRQTIRREAVK